MIENKDSYFTDSDKPFAEHLNDALLLSNVFDFTVPIEAPTMFSNSTWVNTTSHRKCGVAILTLKEQLPSGISTSTSDNKSVLTGSGTVKLGFYPNFNSFGKIKAISWEGSGNITVNLKTVNGSIIASNISKGTIESQSSELRTLQEIVIEMVFTNATLNSLNVVMENKQQERYGAEVGITDVTGLQDKLDLKVNVNDIVNNLNSTATNKPLSANQGKTLNNSIQSLNNSKIDKVSGKGLSTNDFNNDYKSKLDNISAVVTQLYIGSTLKGRLIKIQNGSITWWILQVMSYTAKPASTALTNPASCLFKNPFDYEVDLPTVWIHGFPNTVTFTNINTSERYFGLHSNSNSDVNLANAIYVGIMI